MVQGYVGTIWNDGIFFLFPVLKLLVVSWGLVKP